MEILAAAVACVALAIVVAAFVLSAAAGRLASSIASLRIEVGRVSNESVRKPITVADLPGPSMSSWDGPTDDVELARLEIQKMAFDAPPLIPRGGEARESVGGSDVGTISRGISNGAADR